MAVWGWWCVDGGVVVWGWLCGGVGMMVWRCGDGGVGIVVWGWWCGGMGMVVIVHEPGDRSGSNLRANSSSDFLLPMYVHIMYWYDNLCRLAA